jgi:hypothetical protein|tara:strand:+ start:4401 stop:4673 length:273 start_codon:yes stop_codon:yes gene_type:complete
MLTAVVSDMIKHLKEGLVEVTFEKINDGGTRVMPCTLNPTILESETGKSVSVGSVDPTSSHIAVWGMDVKAWRSFRVSTVTSWKPIREDA